MTGTVTALRSSLAALDLSTATTDARGDITISDVTGPVALSGEIDFHDQRIRSVMLDGEPWFVAQDVCAVLEIKNTGHAVAKLDEDEKGIVTGDTLGGTQRLSIVSESGLYSLVFQSRKPNAKAFRKWITGTVLPSIRKHGGYIRGVEHLSPERQAVYHAETARLSFNAAEERGARDGALRLVNRRRVPSKAQRDRAKVNRIENHRDPRS